MTTLQNIDKSKLVSPVEAIAAGAATRDKRRSWLSVRVFGIGALILVALSGTLTLGTLPRWRQREAVNSSAAAAAAALPRVTVAIVRSQEPHAERVLPGNALPLMEAAMYARATGFVKTRLVDI